MFCPECGKEVKDTALFCGNCGHKIEKALREEISATEVLQDVNTETTFVKEIIQEEVVATTPEIMEATEEEVIVSADVPEPAEDVSLDKKEVNASGDVFATKVVSDRFFTTTVVGDTSPEPSVNSEPLMTGFSMAMDLDAPESDSATSVETVETVVSNTAENAVPAEEFSETTVVEISEEPAIPVVEEVIPTEIVEFETNNNTTEESSFVAEVPEHTTQQPNVHDEYTPQQSFEPEIAPVPPIQQTANNYIQNNEQQYSNQNTVQVPVINGYVNDVPKKKKSKLPVVLAIIIGFIVAAAITVVCLWQFTDLFDDLIYGSPTQTSNVVDDEEEDSEEDNDKKDRDEVEKKNEDDVDEEEDKDKKKDKDEEKKEEEEKDKDKDEDEDEIDSNEEEDKDKEKEDEEDNSEEADTDSQIDVEPILHGQRFGMDKNRNGKLDDDEVEWYIDDSGMRVYPNGKQPSTPKPNSVVVEDSYLFNSDSAYITENYLKTLTEDQIALIRNEIYARHGYIFNTQKYNDYFSAKSWYKPNPNFSTAMFNAIETANNETIIAYETKMGWR